MNNFMQYPETNQRTPARWEPLLLFLVFYLPGYLNQTGVTTGGVMDDMLFHFRYWIQVLPQSALVFHLIRRRGRTVPARYSLRRIRGRDFLALWPILGGLVVLQAGLILTGRLFSTVQEAPLLTQPWMLLPGGVTCLITGYSEELFFHSYLYFTLRRNQKERPDWPTILLINLVFALGHGYQGADALAGTFLMGIFLHFSLLKTDRFHSVALAHALFNFGALLLPVALHSTMP